MKKIAFMCDSAADLTQSEAERLDIHVVRMPLTIDSQSYTEGIDIQLEEIVHALKAGKIVKTSQPVLGDILSMWDSLLENNDEVFYVPMSKALSSTCVNAINLSNQEPYKGRVFVLDSNYIAYPVVHLLQWARKQTENGYSLPEIKNKIEKDGGMQAILIPENLETLKNGGRITPAAAAMAGLLKIQPLLWLDENGIDKLGKVRTLKKAYEKGIEAILKGVKDVNDYYWMIIDADNRKTSDEFLPLLKEATHQDHIEQKQFNAVILSHTGPGTLAFGRIKKLEM